MTLLCASTSCIARRTFALIESAINFGSATPAFCDRASSTAGTIGAMSFAMFGSTSACCTTAVTAPHLPWPMTTISDVPRWAAPYSSVAISSPAATLPATRMTKTSPRPASNTSSGGTRESAHDRIDAIGCCPPSVVSHRRD